MKDVKKMTKKELILEVIRLRMIIENEIEWLSRLKIQL
jgi:hypothetical protein